MSLSDIWQVPGFPLGTFAVNFIGCILLGLFFGLGLEDNIAIPIHEFGSIRILGEFTTFPAFGLESFCVNVESRSI